MTSKRAGTLVTTTSPLLKKPANPVGSLLGFFKNDSN
jgi:hypothetical protein